MVPVMPCIFSPRWPLSSFKAERCHVADLATHRPVYENHVLQNHALDILRITPHDYMIRCFHLGATSYNVSMLGGLSRNLGFHLEAESGEMEQQLGNHTRGTT